jgi:hypothetical protein
VFPVAFKVVAPVILYRLPLDILGATSEAGTTYPFEQPEFIKGQLTSVTKHMTEYIVCRYQRDN